MAHNADVTLRDADGKTALHRAVESRNPSICEYLLSVCMELKLVTDNKGKTPSECATAEDVALVLNSFECS